MAKIVSATAHMKPTAYGKRMIAMATYKKGTSFVAAAILLNRHGGDASAVLHVLCQGIEVLMKGILLVVDYDKFRPQLRALGHDLVKTSETALKAAGLPTFSGAALQDLRTLNTLYVKHLLRYGSSYDVLVDAKTISYGRALRRIAALMRQLQRKGIPNAMAI